MTKRTYADVLKNAKSLPPDDIRRLIADLGEFLEFLETPTRA